MRRLSGSAFLAVALAFAIILASCAPGPTPVSNPARGAAASPSPQPAPTSTSVAPPAAASPSAPKSAAPQYGGVLQASVIANPASFDLQQEAGFHVMALLAPIYNNLIQMDEETGSKVVPALAESWEVSKDNLTYTFKIRNGVKFHDGKPLTTDDVAYSLQRVWKPPKGDRSNLGWLLTAVNKIEKVGDDQVRITLSYPFDPLLNILVHNTFPIFPRHLLEPKGDMKTTAVGTGPFKFKSYTPSVDFQVAKNADYWVRSRPYLDGVTFHIIADRATYLAAIRTGRIDLGERLSGALSPDERDALKTSAPDTVFHQSPNTTSTFLVFNTREGSPFADVRVRRAATLVIDRQAAVKVVASGAGYLGGVFPTYKGWGLSQDELAALPGFRQPKDQDFATAKDLMAQAGYSQGLDIVILSQTKKDTKDAAIFVASQLQSVGIRAKVEILEEAPYSDRVIKANFQVMVRNAADSLPDPYWMTGYLSAARPAIFNTGLKDTKLFDLIDQQARETDPAKRRQILRDIERYVLLETAHAVPLVWPSTFIAVSPKVKGFAPGVSDYVLNRLETVSVSQ